jgi:hypothetical protein
MYLQRLCADSTPQVYASPRALAAYMTQINTVDLTRRSPSYENRLSKYARRGFEVYWPGLDRSRIDPTIFVSAPRNLRRHGWALTSHIGAVLPPHRRPGSLART